MFGTVNEDFDHSIITVHKAVKIHPLRRAKLSPGVYKMQGDVRGKLRHIRDKRLINAGFFSVEFVKGAAKKVSARTVSQPVVEKLPNEASEPVQPPASEIVPEEAPGAGTEIPADTPPAETADLGDLRDSEEPVEAEEAVTTDSADDGPVSGQDKAAEPVAEAPLEPPTPVKPVEAEKPKKTRKRSATKKSATKQRVRTRATPK